MIRNNLAVLMAQRKLKIQHLAEATGLARPTLTTMYYERNTRLDYRTLETLCRFFGVQPGDLLYMTDEAPPLRGEEGVEKA